MNLCLFASSVYWTMPKLDRFLKGGLTSHCSWSGQRTTIPATDQWAALSAIDLIGSLSCIMAMEQCSIQPWCWWSCDSCFSTYTKKEQTCKPVFSCVMPPFLESNIFARLEESVLKMQEQIDAVQQIAQWPHCYNSRLQYTAIQHSIPLAPEMST